MSYLFALLAGFLMVFMPCSLPVIGLKVRAFAEPKKKIPYLLGVWVSFMALATLSVVTGAGLSHMSYPVFRWVLLVVCMVMGLHLVGLLRLNLNVRVPGSAGAFGTGLLTVALGSSCSVPFLAPALAYCASVPAVETFGIFTMLALGFVSPFLLPVPMPKPGPWLEKFEKCCGYALLMVALWLGSTLGSKGEALDIPTGDRAIVVTADWCVNCPIAHHSWEAESVQERLKELGIEIVTLDWTNRDPKITGFLESYHHLAVPFALVEVDGVVTALSGIPSTHQILEALKGAERR